MAQPAPKQPESPRPWYAGLIGFIVAALVLGAVAASTAASYDSSRGDTHADADDDHADEDDDHADE